MERECKLIFRDDTLAPRIFEILSTTSTIGGYNNKGKREWMIEDVYFDTPDLTLERLDCVCRVRKIGEERYLEFKRRIVDAGYKACYERNRFPINTPLWSQIPIIREKLGRFVDLGDKEIEHVLTVKTNRTEIFWEASFSPSGFLMHLDEVRYTLPTSDVIDTQFEVELKEPPDSVNVDVFREILLNLFGLIPIRRSKLSRCSRLLRRIRGLTAGIPQKVILDMDPGVDDALAIFLAMNSPEIEVLAITTVTGNIDAESSARNARIILDFLRTQPGKHFPIPIIAQGCAPDISRQNATNVHGPDGLGGISLEWGEPKTPMAEKNAVELIGELLTEHPKEITIIATGPLTNIAQCIRQCPDAMRQVKELVVMGGVFFESGNRTQTAEFNIHADPKSAKVVLEFCRGLETDEIIPLTFVGLDVTHQVRLRKEWVHALGDKGNPIALFIRRFAAHYMDFYRKNEGLNGCYLHDPLAVGYVIDPTLCETEQYHVEIESEGEITNGMTIADYRPTQIFREKEKEVTGVCVKVDSKRFESLFMRRVFGDDVCSG
jgi:purine nucleosidase